ncbi:MAG: phosphotransferase family protein [Mesorhizobium sp.]|uniref:phosphotransferase family protein n=1 Tax=Mesorhizobium sp. TaxID=1871066 RepID=UPI000FE91CBF|nr:phosphotransferase family protein [Mesorhizobium sp.]RWI54730.1 MAG: phosphotransferase family protein [Mesorhizobium sp.]
MPIAHEYSGTTPLADNIRFSQAALERYMRAHVSGFRGPLTAVQFKGGQSNPTCLIASPSGRYVLRRKPPGALLPSAHAIEREVRVMRALYESSVPVPEILSYCEDEGVLGFTFYLMTYVDGRVLWDAAMPDHTPEQRRSTYVEMNRVLAQMHKVDVNGVGLAGFGRPNNYVARQIERWARQYAASATEAIPDMDRLADWLPHNIPADGRASLVHGDYRIDNLIYDNDRPRILAVLDWELSTVGDSLADLAYHCMGWHVPYGFNRGFGGLDYHALGIPSEEEYLDLYCEQTGQDSINPNVWRFYLAFNLFRAAAIAQGIVARLMSGNAASPLAKDSIGTPGRLAAIARGRILELEGHKR